MEKEYCSVIRLEEISHLEDFLLSLADSVSVAALEARQRATIRKNQIWDDNNEEPKRLVRFLCCSDLSQKK